MKMGKLSLAMGLLSGLVVLQQAVADVSGTVYRDLPVNGTVLNTYGFKDTNEQGVVGVTVTVFPGGATTNTAADGTWGPIGPATGNVRVEFSNWPSYLEESIDTNVQSTSVQFVDATASDVDFGLHNAAQFCEANPDVATTRFVNGDPSHVNAPLETILTFEYGATLKPMIGNKVDTGSTWGVAYDSKRDQLYTSAVLRRHAGMGPSGAGAIYSISAPSSASPTTPSLLYTVPNIGVVLDNTARGLDGLSATVPNHDSSTFSLIAKAGLGDLEISHDNDRLYAVNLNDKLVYSVDLNDLAAAATPLPAFPVTNCNNGEARPWALKDHDGQLYLGVVCSAEQASGTTDDLFAYVYAFDGSNWSTIVDAFALNYPRELLSLSISAAWSPWRDTLAGFPTANPIGPLFGQASPVLSDIEFDKAGNMILGFLDRSSIQFGALNYGTDTSSTSRYQIASGGDVLKATPNGNGTYTVENITVASDEFFKGEEFTPKSHLETAHGGLALLQGSDQIIMPGMDPNRVNTGGIYWLNNSSGAKDQTLELYNGRTTEGFFGKSTGLGDIELLCSPAPLQIGNRVWDDTNGDGLQDADEAGIISVLITLTCGGLTATTTSDANGNWLISDGDMTGGVKIPRDTSCTISVPTAEPGGNNLTTQTVDTTLGSDPDTNGSFTFTTGRSGQNNHTYDIGYRGAVAPSCTINQPTVSMQCNDAGTAGDSSDDTFTYTINTTGTDVGATYSISGDDTQAGLSYGVDNVSAASFLISSGNLALTLTDVDTASCTLNNVVVSVPASCSNAAPVPVIDLQITKTVNPTSAAAGETAIYTITVMNNGPDGATGVVVTDNLPAGVTYQSHSPAAESYVGSLWSIGSLASGSSTSLDINVTAN